MEAKGHSKEDGAVPIDYPPPGRLVGGGGFVGGILMILLWLCPSLLRILSVPSALLLDLGWRIPCIQAPTLPFRKWESLQLYRRPLVRAPALLLQSLIWLMLLR
jgi:hypothetical protein